MLKLRFVLLITWLSIIGLFSSAQSNFADTQKKHLRVQQAYNEKEASISDSLTLQSIDFKSFHILITAFKEEGLLQVWAKGKNELEYKKVRSFSICASSGTLGPKLAQGDRQVPEGFYHIDVFNPASSYHLSLGIDYPNAADRARSSAKDLGGQIFIHGKCVTIGCLPLTDEGIKELYVYAVQAKNAGQSKIPVYIFPFRMSEGSFNKHCTLMKNQASLVRFWHNLKQGYDLFFTNHRALNVRFDSKGHYLY